MHVLCNVQNSQMQQALGYYDMAMFCWAKLCFLVAKCNGSLSNQRFHGILGTCQYKKFTKPTFTCRILIRYWIRAPGSFPCACEVLRWPIQRHSFRTMVSGKKTLHSTFKGTFNCIHSLRVICEQCSGLRLFKKVTDVGWQIVRICAEKNSYMRSNAFCSELKARYTH